MTALIIVAITLMLGLSGALLAALQHIDTLAATNAEQAKEILRQDALIAALEAGVAEVRKPAPWVKEVSRG